MTYDLGVIKRQRYTAPTFSAIGGTISYYTYGGTAYTVHTFLSTGTTNFTVFSTANVDILLVGGGASGISNGPSTPYGAGGNAGQVQTTSTTLTIGQYLVTVGGGGIGNQTGSFAAGGNTSIVGSINVSFASTATGATSGGGSSPNGGGSGAGSAGSGNNGGAGVANNYSTGISTYYGGGGGAYNPDVSGGTGGTGGGGSAGVSATPNTGGGGGGNGDRYTTGGTYYPSGSGGDGIVVIRYPTPIISLVPLNDPYFNYVSLLLSNQSLNVTTPTPIYSNAIPTIEYIAVGGGGAAGQMQAGGNAFHYGGGGGAGGVVYGTLTNVLLSSGNVFVVTIGSGGTGSLTQGAGNGQNSSIVNQSIWSFTTATIIAYGGGQGGQGASSNTPSATVGLPGGSGGGGGGDYGSGGVAGGTSTQVTIVDKSLGNAGGAGGGRGATFNYAYGGGGGGAGSAGQAGGTDTGGAGGSGYAWLNGSTYASGGNGFGGGAGTAYTGNGGNNNGVSTSPGPNGGSGIVVIRYSGTNVLATGGTISTASNYVYHTFTASSVLTLVDGAIGAVTGAPAISPTIKYLLVGGGGAGGNNGAGTNGGGGGAGGLITGTFTITNINSFLSITVGAAGANSSITGSYVTKIAYAGGAGGAGSDFGGGSNPGSSGGSGGGGGAAYPSGGGAGGSATQSSSASGGYGNAGATGVGYATAGGGGGAGSAGSGGTAGRGLYINTPSSTYSQIYAAGGSGVAAGAAAGGANTGYGGGQNGYSGGSGVSILWEPASNAMPTLLGNPTVITTSGFRVYVFKSSGGIVFNPSLSNNLITDSSSNGYVVSPNGSPTQGSFNPYTANWSMYFNGSSYLSIPNTTAYGTTGLGLNSSNFTIEGWVYFNSVASGQLIGHSGSAWKIAIGSGNALAYYLSSNGSTWNIANAVSIGTVAVGQWYHFALVRNGSTFTPYLNGVAGTPTTSASSLYAYTSNLTIGNIDGTYFSGYLSNIRILKDTALYTSAFTPAIAPLPLISNTLLLTCASGILKDKSSYSWTINQYGTPAVKKFSPFANVGSYNTTLVGGSAYFNGTSDSIKINSTSTVNVPDWTYLHNGTTDYTIEGWVYPLTTASIIPLIATSDLLNTSVPGMELEIFNGNLFWTVMNGTSAYVDVTAYNIIKPNAWSHIAFTFASSNKKANIYLNGVKVGTNSLTTSTFTATSASYPLTIGRSPIPDNPYYYTGYMSNLRILKGVISDSVVTTNLSTGTTLEYLIVAGGGAGSGTSATGYGGGGGGFRTGTAITTQSGAIYTITVGNGGSGAAGGNSSLVGGGINIVSAGGGYATGSGGSGGGNGGTGNVPATSPAQGYNGVSGGGGGATGAGGGTGGPGALSNIDGLGYYYAGGGGAANGGIGSSGGIGGGGSGTGSIHGANGGSDRNSSTGFAGGVNSGGGGGGGNTTGGSGIVIIRYLGPQRAVGGDIVTTNISGYTVHTFLQSGTLVDNIQTYTIPTSPVLASSTNTNLLLNFTDAKIVDASLNTDITTIGDAGMLSNVKKFNNMSMYFDGTLDSLTLSSSTIALGAGAFTVEMWMYPLTVYNTGNAPALLDARTSGDGAGLIRFGYNGTTLPTGGVIGWKENTSYVVTATVTTNAWQHVAVVRNSGIISMYINGALSSTATNTTNYTVPFKYIGSSYDSLYWNGYMDDLRITNGIARYTSAFTPPTYKPQLK